MPAKMEVLASLDEPERLVQIAEDNGLALGTARKAVGTLEADGLVETHREGRDLVVHPSSKALSSLAKLVLHDSPRRDWTDVFRGDRPTVLHVLDRVGHPALTAEVCGKSRRAVYYTIEKLAPEGLLVETGDGYGINPRLSDLPDLLAEMAGNRAHNRALEVHADARLVWHLGPELLLRCEHEIGDEDVHAGALSALAAYGVPLVEGETSFYYVASRELDAADAILQSLLADPESRVNRSYAALAYEKCRPEDLEHKARLYGLETEARNLVTYVEDREQVGRFLPWAEHDEYRRRYEVGA